MFGAGCEQTSDGLRIAELGILQLWKTQLPRPLLKGQHRVQLCTLVFTGSVSRSTLALLSYCYSMTAMGCGLATPWCPVKMGVGNMGVSCLQT